MPRSPSAFFLLGLPWLVAIAGAAVPARADDEVPKNLPRLVNDPHRMPFLPSGPDKVALSFHGELQLRYENDSRLRLTAPVTAPDQLALGQRNWATLWLRLGGQLSVYETLKVVVQADLAPNWILGDTTQGVGAARDRARDETLPPFARLRYAYADLTTGVGLFRLGFVGNHWGMGVLANDGDHAPLFGDYKLGSIVARAAFATRPLGNSSPWVVAVAGDAVVSDATASWSRGDRTYQAVLSTYWEKDHTQFGFFGTRRWQKVREEDGSGSDGRNDVWIGDVAARTATTLADDVYAFFSAEVAVVRGKTTAIRSLDHLEQTIASYGGAVVIGVVGRSKPESGPSLGRWVVQLEGGYASGDADPYDGTVRRFTFDPNHQIGLVLFPFLLHFQTARAATNALDPSLVARPMPGARFLTSNGGVFGAQYLNPTVVFRPCKCLDLKAGAVVAVATSDVVDPYRTATTGEANYEGGSVKSRDLGLELDVGAEWHKGLSAATLLQLGVQAGVLFPGHAFDDAGGLGKKPQSVVQGRVGVQF